MRSTFIVSLFLALVAVAGCSSDTGLLINTSTNENLASRIDSLRYYVGESTIAESGYYADDNPLDDVELDGRDIFEEPHRLLIRPDDEELEIVVAVLAYDANGEAVAFGRLPGPIRFSSGNVLEWDVELIRIDDGVFQPANDCVKWREDTGDFVHLGRTGDLDCDGYLDGEDCDDLNPNVHPGRAENCENEVDDDCNGLADSLDTEDRDNDGFFACGDLDLRDCNNDDEFVYPGAPERCDGRDNNCNNLCDEGHDADGDFVTSCGSVLSESGSECVVEDGSPDCNDENSLVHPGAEELCDGIDNNCSGACDDESDLDLDDDLYTTCGSELGICGSLDPRRADCNDNDPNVHPGAQELCDGIDQNCDGLDEPERVPCLQTGDNVCRQGSRECGLDGVVGECGLDGLSVDPEFCESYDGCQEPDPFACVLEGDAISPALQEDCEVGSAVSAAGNVQCEGNIVAVLPPDGAAQAAECTYALIGGSIQQGYQAELLDGDTGISANVVQSCDVLLRVRPQVGAREAIIRISVHANLQSFENIEVHLKGHITETCEAKRGLACDTWPDALLPIGGTPVP